MNNRTESEIWKRTAQFYAQAMKQEGILLLEEERNPWDEAHGIINAQTRRILTRTIEHVRDATRTYEGLGHLLYAQGLNTKKTLLFTAGGGTTQEAPFTEELIREGLNIILRQHQQKEQPLHFYLLLVGYQEGLWTPEEYTRIIP